MLVKQWYGGIVQSYINIYDKTMLKTSRRAVIYFTAVGGIVQFIMVTYSSADIIFERMIAGLSK